MATLDELNSRLAMYRNAEQSILTGGASVRIGERQVAMADLAVIQREIANLEIRIARASNGGFSHGVAVFGGRRG